MKVLIINGPNLNLLGKREPKIYGNTSFETYFEELKTNFLEHHLSYYQSNHEGDLVDALQNADGNFDCIVLNAAAYTHTSVAIADAVSALKMPVIEVHISNIYAREEFRRKSFISPYAKAVIAGFGLKSYDLALLSL